MQPTKTITEILHGVPKHPHNRTRVAAYCRVSSDSDDQMNSFMAQMTYYTNLIANNPEWELADIYADEGITGTSTKKRNEYKRMLKDCRDGKIDRILVKSVSRFARNTTDCLEAVRELKLIGVSVCFVKEDIDSEILTEEMILSVNGSIAQEESISISKNMRWSCRKRMEKGIYITGTVPYGYHSNSSNWEIVPEEAEVVRRIFGLYLQGYGKCAIMEILNADGITNRNGLKWNISGVNYVLNNERYTGNALFQKTFATDAFPYKTKKNCGELPMYFVSDTNPAIIGQEKWDAVAEYRKRKNREPYQKQESVFSGTARCSCGSRVRLKTINGIRYLVCVQHENKGSCPVMQVPESEAQNAFVNMANKLRINGTSILSNVIEQMEAMYAKANSSTEKIYEIDRQIAEQTEKLHLLTRLKLKNLIDAADYIKQSDSIDRGILELRQKRRKLLNISSGDSTIEKLKYLKQRIEDIDVTLTGFDNSLYAEIVSQTILKNSDTVIFRLIGGIELCEEIQHTRRCVHQ